MGAYIIGAAKQHAALALRAISSCRPEIRSDFARANRRIHGELPRPSTNPVCVRTGSAAVVVLRCGLWVYDVCGRRGRRAQARPCAESFALGLRGRPSRVAFMQPPPFVGPLREHARVTRHSVCITPFQVRVPAGAQPHADKGRRRKGAREWRSRQLSPPFGGPCACAQLGHERQRVTCKPSRLFSLPDGLTKFYACIQRM